MICRFLDLGANDGVTFSNTKALYDFGWNGTYIEASPSAYNRLLFNLKNKTAIETYNIAICDKDGEFTFNESSSLINKNDIGLVSTFHECEVSRFKDVVTYKKVIVNSLKWETFIKKTPYKDFDFISMDIEGSEMDVLPFMNLSKTKCLCIEWNGSSYLKKEYEKYLSGFNLISSNPENLIYAR